MNKRIEELAKKASVDANQIVAEVVCPDYNGDELWRLADAFNVLPKEIRSNIVKTLDENQRKFAELLLQDFCNTLEEQMRFDKVMKKEVGLDFEIDFVKEIKKFYASGFCACCGAPNNTPCDDSCVWSE